ncbi:MAG TPA: excinuclease ABC subunit UvrC, partial [Myxococcales bacterium]|nr:excinuclease ABC subunit UvrC [Myxococcales bacterium]
MPSQELQRKLDALPAQPGCYIMKDRAGEVVYVGKAVNLRARVAQYFQDRTGDSRIFIPFLSELLGDIEVMITPSEKDALLLENELIKKHRPRFNIRLRDDKNFISLRLSRTHPYPRLEVVRRVRKDGARYFGPYSSASSIRETLGIVNRHFQLRTCTDQVMANRRRPCLQYQIKRCPAPCVYAVPQDEYQRSVEEVALFLEGKADQLTAQLSSRMKDAAGKLQYERAAQLRDQLQAIERSLEKQRTVLGEALDQDVLGFHREGGLLEIQLLFFRGGRLSGGRSFNFSKQEFPTEELLSSFLDQYYESGAFIPKELLLPQELPDPEARESWLSERKGERVRVHVPERGEKARLLEMARENARHNFDERQRTQKNSFETLQRLQTRLRLPRLPRRIECFDVSTFQGQLTVGSQVVFTDGEPDKSGYRLFKVRGEAAGDDFASMFQVLTRRLQRGIEQQDLPDLLLVDGGKGQLNVARAALKEVGLSPSEVPLAGLAKSRVLEDEERFAARQGYVVSDAWAPAPTPDATP